MQPIVNTFVKHFLSTMTTQQHVVPECVIVAFSKYFTIIERCIPRQLYLCFVDAAETDERKKRYALTHEMLCDNPLLLFDVRKELFRLVYFVITSKLSYYLFQLSTTINIIRSCNRFLLIRQS
jgi:hypothetical protein